MAGLFEESSPTQAAPSRTWERSVKAAGPFAGGPVAPGMAVRVPAFPYRAQCPRPIGRWAAGTHPDSQPGAGGRGSGLGARDAP